MSNHASGRSQYRGSKRTPVLFLVLVVVGMVVLFAAGFGLSMVLRGGNNNANGGGGGGSSSSSASESPTPEPCTTTMVIPGQDLPKPAAVTANVYNATSRAGLAKSTSEVLKGRGFVIGKVDNDPLKKTITGVAEIRYGAAALKNAELMAFYFPGAILVPDSRKTTDVDVVLGETFATVASQSDVDKALNTPSPSASGPGCSTTPAPVPTDTNSGGTTPAPTESSSATDSASTEPMPSES